MCQGFFYSLSFYSKSPPHLRCPCHHWATVEVVSGRGMMPNLTGVEPYLYSLHSRFCFKGFVYTRPINHLLASHNPTAFKVCASPGDNVQRRCQRKSLLLVLLRKEAKVSRPLVTLSSQVSLLSLLLRCPWPWSLSRHITPTQPHKSSDYQTFTCCTPWHESAWPTTTSIILYAV